MALRSAWLPINEGSRQEWEEMKEHAMGLGKTELGSL